MSDMKHKLIAKNLQKKRNEKKRKEKEIATTVTNGFSSPHPVEGGGGGWMGG